MSNRRAVALVGFALICTIPGIYAALTHLHTSPQLMALLAGAAVLASSFLLLWACDAAQEDVSQALALAAVALIAVLPEYAVDIYFTWQAGKFPDSDYSHYAIANMTGANRLIIGVAWAAVVLIFWLKTRRSVAIERDRLLEVRFLTAATVYALFIPIKGTLAWYDGIVLMALFVWYIVLAAKRPQGECEAEGPGACIAALPCGKRRATTILLLLFAAATVILNAERFCEGLVGTGKVLGISEFLLVQWLAPIASEAPEFILAIMFAARARAGLALGSLVSAKLNQWTLLVGMIPGVFALSSGSIASPIPMGAFQMNEIFLTAAQSLLAVVLLATLRLTFGHALLLFGLFAGQLVLPAAVDAFLGGSVFGVQSAQVHTVFSFLYLVGAVVLILDQPRRLRMLWPLCNDPEECPECGARYEEDVTEALRRTGS